MVHGFSTRLNESLPAANRLRTQLDLGYTSRSDSQTILNNRQHFVRLAGWQGQGHVTLKQMHSGLCRRVSGEDLGDQAKMWGDGLVTDEPGVLLGILTADCLPILVADRKRQVVAAFHAGWRGTLKRIVERGVATLTAQFNSFPCDLTAAIGPGIGACCFAVGEDLPKLFLREFEYGQELFSGGVKPHLDLVEANRRQLQDAGVRPEAIFTSGECTSCRNEQYFSYRAEHGVTGRMLAIIGILPDSPN